MADDNEHDDIELSPQFEEEVHKAGLDPNGVGEPAKDEPEDDADDEPEDEDLGDEPEDDADDEPEDDDHEPVAAAADSADPPKKRTARDRIKELAAARRESERAAYEAEMRARELERRLAEAEAARPAAAEVIEPDPKDFKYGEVDQGYLDAMVEFRVAKREQEREQERAEAARQQQTHADAARYRERLTEVMATGEKKYTGFREAIEDTSFDPDLARMVLDSDLAVDVAFHLSQNIRDLRALTTASPQERVRQLGRLEGKLSAASAVKKTKSPKTPETSRKKPAKKEAEGIYGPDDQDQFDKVFYGR